MNVGAFCARYLLVAAKEVAGVRIKRVARIAEILYRWSLCDSFCLPISVCSFVFNIIVDISGMDFVLVKAK
jgi:hypothetical protein